MMSSSPPDLIVEPADMATTARRAGRRLRVPVVLAGVALLAATAVACGDSGDASSTDSAISGSADARTVRVLTHDSFAVSEEVLDEFEARSGITIEIVN